MTIQTPDDVRETASFKIAEQKIENLLKRLHDKCVCPCCTARALTYHGASMAEHTTGSAEAIEMLEAIIMHMREHEAPAPDPMPSTEAH
jgi:queuine/archaeosine tRNA-ribosyltransferase